ncbi:glycosyl hydrolase family 95 catalytic domain-containing protein [Pedobacter alpinus]|uniref:glycosyl hydrolase family 95 catalytic domain-containing protein n=1 Tax=Pedobacter alpinus TaxID=1590643 RepID=UPI00360CE7F3
MNFWARLLNGNHSYLIHQELLKTATLNNLFDTHPSFQIDGNFGATSGVSEMLIQSHLDKIQLLLAFADALANGFINGLGARGNFVINTHWAIGSLATADVLVRNGVECAILSKMPI